MEGNAAVSATRSRSRTPTWTAWPRSPPRWTSVGIGLAAHLHFWASTPACRYAQEFSVAARNEGTRVLSKRLMPEDGYLAVPDRPGLGVELDEDEVERMRG
jgi:D-galactarolactone cycloisomerase